MHAERTEARPADAAALTTTRKVQLTDLVGSLAASGSAALGTVKTQMSQLKRASLSLAKPLDRGVREEIERDVVYTTAAKEISKWVRRRLGRDWAATGPRLGRDCRLCHATENLTDCRWVQMPRVTANRKAEHLSFGDTSSVKQASSTGLVVKFQPETALEKQVNTLTVSCCRLL